MLILIWMWAELAIRHSFPAVWIFSYSTTGNRDRGFKTPIHKVNVHNELSHIGRSYCNTWGESSISGSIGLRMKLYGLRHRSQHGSLRGSPGKRCSSIRQIASTPHAQFSSSDPQQPAESQTRTHIREQGEQLNWKQGFLQISLNRRNMRANSRPNRQTSQFAASTTAFRRSMCLTFQL